MLLVLLKEPLGAVDYRLFVRVQLIEELFVRGERRPVQVDQGLVRESGSEAESDEVSTD